MKTEIDTAKTTLEEEADAVIREFDEWFQSGNNAPLTRPEKATVKTFYWFLLHREELKKTMGV